jgi:ectoine hydroxylase
MKLTNEQVTFYHNNGYLQINNYLIDSEVDALCSEIPNTIEKDSPRVILEDNGTVRSVFAPHFINKTYDKLIKLKKFVEPSEQLLESPIYLHQYKINTKIGLKGDWWEWHQDFPYWHIDDDIEAPQMISIMIYLQDTDSANGALLVIPKSHHLGIVKFENKNPSSFDDKIKYNQHHKNTGYLSSLNSNIKFTIDHHLLKELAHNNGIVTAAGKRGSVVFFHGNLFHASNINMTPFDRHAVIITYNSINNLPTNNYSKRPEFLAGRNYNAIEGIESIIPA